MHKFLNPWVNLAGTQVLAFSRFVFEPEAAPADRMETLWRGTLSSQAQFVDEVTETWLQLLARQRALIRGQFARLSEDAERITAELARTTARAVGIATHARRARRDRRIFSVPLPVDRRSAPRSDRRVKPGKAALSRAEAP